MVEENNKKKVIISTILVGIFLLVLLIGATYAYFSIDMGSSSTSTKISIETGKLNSIAITNKIPNIHINLTASDMSSTSTIKEFYATDNKDLPYETEANKMLDIAEISVVGNVDVRNFCSADVIVSLTEGDTMGTFLQPNDSELYINAGDLEETLDLSTIKEARTQKYTANFEVMGSNPHAIKSYLKINNREDDQSDLAGKELHLSIEIKNFSCTTDNTAPTIAKFYLKEDKEESKYTNAQNIEAYLSWLDEDVKEYCITKENTNKDCIWDSITNENNITKQITLDSEEKEYIYNAYLKDKANNISDVLSDSITLDTTPPTITNVTSTEITSTTIGVKVTGNDTNGIDKYCYGTNQDSYTCTENNTYTFDNLNAGQEYTFYFYIIDKAGNDNKANATQQKFTTKQEPKPAKDVVATNSEGKTLETITQAKSRNSSDDLRRFVGTYSQVTDNFICFGTDNQQTCKDNKDTYMYRIIGIDTGGRLKLIKATKLVQGSSNTSTFAWHNNYNNTYWNNSDLYKRLNGTHTSYPNIFIGNDKYSYMQEEKWTNLIYAPTYYIGDTTSSSNPTVFQNERTKNFTGNKIGLMYLSDYLYANDGQTNTNNWLFIQNGLNGKDNTPTGSIAPSATAEWTMTRYTYYDTSHARLVNGDGTLETWSVNVTFAVRPVFYLSSEIKITDGNGDINTPYIISAAA